MRAGVAIAYGRPRVSMHCADHVLLQLRSSRVKLWLWRRGRADECETGASGTGDISGTHHSGGCVQLACICAYICVLCRLHCMRLAPVALGKMCDGACYLHFPCVAQTGHLPQPPLKPFPRPSPSTLPLRRQDRRCARSKPASAAASAGQAVCAVQSGVGKDGIDRRGDLDACAGLARPACRCK